MTDRPAFLLWPVALTGLAALLYAINQHRRSMRVLEQIHDSINDIHGYLLPVSKGSEKAAR